MSLVEVDRRAVPSTIVEESVHFTLEGLCHACGTDRLQVIALVHEGVLDPAGGAPEQWLFSGPALSTTRTALRLSQELELGLAGVALVLDLLREIDTLRTRLHRAGCV
jgi:chaperone modulatory protein CbpM